MKKVFNSDGVAHAWAAAINSSSNTQDGRNATRSFWFNNRVLYSYRTPVAVLVRSMNDIKTGVAVDVALISSDNYSPTTNRQLSSARSAASHLLQFSVPCLGNVSSQGQYRAPRDAYTDDEKADCERLAHVRNLTYLVAKYKESAASMTRVRKLYRDDAADVEAGLIGLASIARKYAEVFGLSAPVFDTAADAALIWAAHLKREARYADPQYGEKLRVARDKREAAKERKAERDRAKLAQQLADAREHFRMNTIGSSSWRVDSEHGGAMLRLNRRGDAVETSWGIRDFPLKLARKIVTDYLENWHRIAVGAEVHGFTIRGVDGDGLQIGCHDFARAEIEQFAKLL